MKRKVLGALGLLALIATPVLAAGLWANLPLVGGAAFCSSTNLAGVPGTSTVCTSTVPAGPSAVTGLETVPADTNASSGPSQVRLSLASLGALPLSYVAVIPSAASFSNVMNVTDGGVVFTSAATITPTINVTLPATPIDGQQFRLSANQSIPTLAVTAGSNTVANAPLALTISTVGNSQGYAFRFRSADTKWYRVQ